jgi:hypothetical protein
MKFYGDIELINGSILNLKVEELETLDVDTVDTNRLVVHNGALYFNNGVAYYPLMFDNSFDENPLIMSLGQNWLNENQSFNPVPFNDLDNVSDLVSTDSLFNVIQQLDSAISALEINSIFDLSDATQSAPFAEGQILLYGVDSFFNLPLQDAFDSYVQYNITDAEDFSLNVILTESDIMTWDADIGKFTNTKSYYTYSSDVLQASYTLAHHLGKKYCIVEVIDKTTNLKIPSDQYTVEYFTNDILGVVLDTPAIAHIIVFSLS